MGVEVRKIETTYAETGGVEDRVEVTYELGFATPSGGWVRFMSVPEAQVIAAEDNAKAANQPAQPSPDLSPQPDEAPTMADVTPTPTPQADAAAGEAGAPAGTGGTDAAPAGDGGGGATV